MNSSSRRYTILVTILLLFSSDLQAGNLRVVGSIRPIHSITASVMVNSGNEPHLLIDSQASLHGLQLQPSRIKQLRNADFIIWIGPAMESYLQKPIRNLEEKIDVIELMTTPGITILAKRQAVISERKAPPQKKSNSPPGHNPGQWDEHLWLNPQNAIQFAFAISHRLQQSDPENADTYQKNAQRFAALIKKNSLQMQQKLAMKSEQTLIVYHDAYQAFASYFGLHISAAISLDPEQPVKLSALAKINHLLTEKKSACIVYDTPHRPRILNRLQKPGVRIHYIDPIGRDLNPGPNLYLQLLQNMTAVFSLCLAEPE